jgi:glycosyltransferase involved in cell wall biosynthesis
VVDPSCHNDASNGEGPLIGLLTGGDDRSYAHGLAISLAAADVLVEFIGSDALDGEVLRRNEKIRFLNLRGDQSEDAPLFSKVIRLCRYYLRLLLYAVRTRAPVLHILWNNKFELFDRTLLMLFYRLCGRKVVLTAHNVNAAKRDGYDSWLNRLTLSIQYRLCSHLFVHTEKMRSELHADFAVPKKKISVIPFGLNDTSPRTKLTHMQARAHLGIETDELVLLFFGQIAPYKGLRYLVEAFPDIYRRLPRVRLVIAGKVKRGCEEYWESVEKILSEMDCRHRILCRIEHIPDEDIEVYFKAADALVVPYVQIFQSGLPFLAYSFGLPVLATDVGSLGEEIFAGQTGFVCESCDTDALTSMILRYAESDLYQDLSGRRAAIADAARERHSWTTVADITRTVYEKVAA